MRPDRRTDEFDAFAQRDGELDLPDDLVLMGEQLADDAQRLASSYPPKFGPVREVAAAVASVLPRHRVRRPWLYVGSAACGLIAVGLLLALIIIPKNQQQAAPPAAIAGPRGLAVDHLPIAIVESPAESSPRELAVPAVFSGNPPPLAPAAWERGVTGAEMEGLMDLRRMDNLAIDVESLEF